jgi:hypothetical protein
MEATLKRKQVFVRFNYVERNESFSLNEHDFFHIFGEKFCLNSLPHFLSPFQDKTEMHTDIAHLSTHGSCWSARAKVAT